jgi:hypothetical protein
MSDPKFFRKYLDIINEAPQMSAREADMQRRMAATRAAGNNVAPGTSQTTTGPTGSMTVSKTGPATAINPNDPNAAAFGKQINAPQPTTAVNNQSSGYSAQSQAQRSPSANTNQSDLASQYVAANQPKSQPAVNNQSSGYNAQSQAQKTPAIQSNVDTAATAARDKLQQQMASGKTAAPASNVVNPNQQYGGGYDPSKVQYASGSNPKAAPTASATQSAALDQSKANAIGGGAQQTAQQATPVNNQSSGYNAQSQAQNTLPQTTPTASTGGGFQGGGYGSVGTQGQTASAPTQTSDQIATTALNAPSTQTASADQSTSGQSLGRPAAFGQVAEELDEELEKILRLSGRQKNYTNENTSLKKFYSIINESTDNEVVDLYDSFDIELNEHFVIETGIIGFTEDGIIIEADDTILGLLEVNNILCEDETMDQREEEMAEAEYQGRKVQLGKPMAGDVKKSKVYVKKPNGKVVKVNFGDKKMKIKKSNPKRRKSFRARHRCENPGPRWKARYWSCRAW